MVPFRRLAMAALSLAAGLGTGQADQGWEGHILNLTWENDATAGSDRHYTQGAKISYLSSDTTAPGWLDAMSERIPSLGFRADGLKLGVEIGQEMYTPENLEATQPIRNDRPYAGWLYASVLGQRRGPGPADIPAMEQLRLDLGVIGPESYAADTQKIWHGRDPKGWGNQLRTEVGFALRYDRSYLFRFRSRNRFDLDLIPSFDASAGSVDTHLGLGVMTRCGYNIPNKYEAPGRRTPKEFGAYFFVAAGDRFVIRNIFLDGNTWVSSHSVHKEPLVGSLKAGITVVLKCVELTASQSYLTREFRKQQQSDSFGSATVTIKF
jgi:hypothetical protein